jgi:hypothetical protein
LFHRAFFISPQSKKDEDATMRPNHPVKLKTTPGEDAETQKLTAVQEDKPKPSAVSLLSQPSVYAEEQWKRASNMLQTNPTLVTNHILCMALKHRPPLHVIHFMLHLNSKAASIPKKGPTPLQIAVQSSCSLEVIKALINACPFALVATNPGSYLDPLSYAKRFRPTEKELIALLSLPLSYWLSCSTNGTATATSTSTSTDSKQSVPSAASTNSYKSAAGTPRPPQSQEQQQASTPSGLNTNYHYNPIRSTLSVADRQELNNVKALCAGVLKGHKRLSRELDAWKEKDQLPSPTTAAAAPTATEPSQLLLQQQQELVVQHQEENASLLVQMQAQQQKHFRVQLIALDMKERAMRAHVRRMERRVIQQVLEYNKNQFPEPEQLPPPPPQQQQQLTMDDTCKSVIRSLQMQVQNFQHRLEQVEGHLEPRARYEFHENPHQPCRSLPGNGNGNSNYFGSSKIAAYSNRYRLPYNNNNNSNYNNDDHDTCCSSTKVVVRPRRGTTMATSSTGPVVFCTPLPEAVVKNQDDDSLSLLTEDMHVTRHGHGNRNHPFHQNQNKHYGPQRFWWLTRMGRRCWLVVVQHD